MTRILKDYWQIILKDYRQIILKEIMRNIKENDKNIKGLPANYIEGK
jgi:hypothetical protein